jgi:hypothetical protein
MKFVHIYGISFFSVLGYVITDSSRGAWTGLCFALGLILTATLLSKLISIINDRG